MCDTHTVDTSELPGCYVDGPPRPSKPITASTMGVVFVECEEIRYVDRPIQNLWLRISNLVSGDLTRVCGITGWA